MQCSKQSLTSLRYALILPLFLLPSASHAQIITAHSQYWTTLTTGGNGIWDAEGDQQTGDPEADFVGTAGSVPSSYIAFQDTNLGNLTEGNLFFRTRHSLGDGDYRGQLWVGIEANGDNVIDLFVGVDRSGSQNTFGILIRNPGTKANDAPNTTSIDNSDLSPSRYALTSSNYAFVPVSAANFNGTTDANTAAYAAGAGTDYFQSFSVPFQDIVSNLNTTGQGRPTAISINQNSNLKYVFLTAQQSNAINQDFNGVNGITNSFPFNDPITPGSSLIVPEPSTLMLLLPGLLLLRRRRK